MISLVQFFEIFMKRHDFVYDDIDLLRNRFSHIKFNNIPEAWVCEIDTHLSKVDTTKISIVSQTMGFLHIDCMDLSAKDRKVLSTLEKRLYSIDIDLHEQLHEGIILN